MHFFEKWAQKSGNILGDNVNVYTDGEREKYQRFLYSIEMNTNLGEFSAGAITALLVFFGIGAGLVFGIFHLYLGIEFVLLYPLIGGSILGILSFFIFRTAPKIVYSSRVRNLERNIIRFVPTMAAAVASGLSIEDAIEQGKRSNFGYLSTELKRIDKWKNFENIIEALGKSKNQIDSSSYSRIMGTIMHIRSGGIEKIPDLPPSKQPAASSLMELQKEERDKFKDRCNEFEKEVKPLTTVMNILFTVLPMLTIIISVVTAIQPQQEMIIPPLMLRVGTVILMPALTIMIVYTLYKKEPR